MLTAEINNATEFIGGNCLALPIAAGRLWGKVEEPKMKVYKHYCTATCNNTDFMQFA